MNDVSPVLSKISNPENRLGTAGKRDSLIQKSEKKTNEEPVFNLSGGQENILRNVGSNDVTIDNPTEMELMDDEEEDDDPEVLEEISKRQEEIIE
jgi:hypothetical protein